MLVDENQGIDQSTVQTAAGLSSTRGIGTDFRLDGKDREILRRLAGQVAELAARPASEKLIADPNIPADTELWAALQSVSGGSWGGCVYDTARIKQLLTRPSSP